MKQKIFTLLLFLLASNFLNAQNSFLGIQNSQRKSMHSVGMNPAEINNLNRKIEVNLFSLQGSLGNNILSFQDVLQDPDNMLETVFQNANKPVNVRTNVEVLGPSLGIKLNRWAFGISSQSFASLNVIDLDPKLGESISSNRMGTVRNEFSINSPLNQRININGWTELGVTAGLELIELNTHSLSVGATFKLLFPYLYTNVGLDKINGTLIQENDEVYLTNINGSANLSYSNDFLEDDAFGFTRNAFNFQNLEGFGVDLGATYSWKDDLGTKVNAGLSLRNLGSMTFGRNQVNRTYQVNIPANEIFRLDNLEGNLNEIEQQLVESGYFSNRSQLEGIQTSLPALLAAYGELKISRIFYLSVYAQQRFNSVNNNDQLPAQNLFAVTPRLILGNFEVYSPWVRYEVAGLTGGIGFRFGGFFIGSHSVLTGLIADTNQADIHIGLSLGFGKN
ncbi:DUF5723 family protein [Cecembia sp.]|uniref:DUF5723 family protein n=2 Tax=Cecembia sp. TaxID=1898110 RepID=UPI0025C02ABF|nr:DUF5723 family protein [Cecembia sp.]